MTEATTPAVQQGSSLSQVQKIIPGHGWLLHRPVIECSLLVRCFNAHSTPSNALLKGPLRANSQQKTNRAKRTARGGHRGQEGEEM